MSLKFKQWIMALLLTTVGSANCWAAAADITCSIVNGVSFPINPYVVGGSTNYVGRQLTVECTRTGNAANGETVVVSVTVSNGGNPSGSQNRATGSGTVDYDFYTAVSPSCSSETNPVINFLTATVVFVKNDVTKQALTNMVYACVPVPGTGATGAYSDNATASIPATGVVPSNNGRTGSPTGVPVNLVVNIFIPERCVINMPAGPLTFEYTSFTTSASQPSKQYDVTCGSSLSPTMALTDAGVTPLTSGTAAGLAYTLALNTSGNSTGGTSSLAVTSGGGLKTYRINGNMVAGQAGSCAFPAVQSGSTCNQTITGVHYLTVTW